MDPRNSNISYPLCIRCPILYYRFYPIPYKYRTSPPLDPPPPSVTPGLNGVDDGKTMPGFPGCGVQVRRRVWEGPRARRGFPAVQAFFFIGATGGGCGTGDTKYT